MNIGERIRWLRTRHKMTMETLADKVGVTRQTISRYETMVIEDIPKSKLESIAKALNVSYDYLSGLTIESQRDSMEFDLHKQIEILYSANSDDEREEIERSIFVLRESYEDLCYALRLRSTSSGSKQNRQAPKSFTIGSRTKEWHSDKKSNLTMAIDSWLLLALKGMAADSNRDLADEIEEALYDHVMCAIEEETSKQDAVLDE